MDGTPYAVYPHGIDSSGNGDNPLLQGAPKSFTCPPPAIPYSPAIKRHVTNPTVYGAWACDALTDVAHLADTTLTPVPAGPDIPAAPKLVTPDDGSAGVYIVDGAVVRHVQDPNSMTAWHFSGSELVKMPAAQFHAMPQGLAWPETPFLAQGSGPPVYMIDLTTPPPEADGGGVEGGAANGGSGSSSGAGGGGPTVGDAAAAATGDASWESNQGTGGPGSSGGCSAGGSPGGAPWPIAALAGLVGLAPAFRWRGRR